MEKVEVTMIHSLANTWREPRHVLLFLYKFLQYYFRAISALIIIYQVSCSLLCCCSNVNYAHLYGSLAFFLVRIPSVQSIAWCHGMMNFICNSFVQLCRRYRRRTSSVTCLIRFFTVMSFVSGVSTFQLGSLMQENLRHKCGFVLLCAD